MLCNAQIWLTAGSTGNLKPCFVLFLFFLFLFLRGPTWEKQYCCLPAHGEKHDSSSPRQSGESVAMSGGEHHGCHIEQSMCPTLQRVPETNCWKSWLASENEDMTFSTALLRHSFDVMNGSGVDETAAFCHNDTIKYLCGEKWMQFAKLNGFTLNESKWCFQHYMYVIKNKKNKTKINVVHCSVTAIWVKYKWSSFDDNSMISLSAPLTLSQCWQMWVFSAISQLNIFILCRRACRLAGYVEIKMLRWSIL